MAHGPELICAVGPDGKFTAEAPDYQGRWVKDCDKDIARDLKRPRAALPPGAVPPRLSLLLAGGRGSADSVPAARAGSSRRPQFKDEMLANNEQINWLPEHIKHGRFGNFLEIERRLGALPRTLLGHAAADLGLRADRQDGSDRQLRRTARQARRQGTEVGTPPRRRKPELPDDLKVHKPYIDAVTYDSPLPPARMKRVTEVIDCWYDSGAMPFAQWGYPHLAEREVSAAVPRRLHQRSARSDARLVL